MKLPDLTTIERAAKVVYSAMMPTAQYRWPLLCERVGTEVWIKHENHAPLGNFKMRSGMMYFQRLKESGSANGKVVTATRGNYGQAVALGAQHAGMEAV